MLVGCHGAPATIVIARSFIKKPKTTFASNHNFSRSWKQNLKSFQIRGNQYYSKGFLCQFNINCNYFTGSSIQYLRPMYLSQRMLILFHLSNKLETTSKKENLFKSNSQKLPKMNQTVQQQCSSKPSKQKCPCFNY